MERYLNMLPNFSSEDDIIQFIKQSFPKLPGLILTTQVGLGRFYWTAVWDAICQTQQSELQDLFKHSIVTQKKKKQQIYNLLHVFILTPTYSAKQHLIM